MFCSVSTAMRKNNWRYWRPIYSYTWAKVQRSSYDHFQGFTEGGNKLVLDIGTGTGEYVKNLSPNNKYIFTDIDPVALKITAKYAKEYLKEGNYEIFVCDALEAIKRHKDVDVISIIHVVSVISNPRDLIKTAINHLKPGGILLIYISRISKKIDWFCNPLFRTLGFRLMDVGKITNGLLRKKIGMLNDCYIYEKPL